MIKASVIILRLLLVLNSLFVTKLSYVGTVVDVTLYTYRVFVNILFARASHM